MGVHWGAFPELGRASCGPFHAVPVCRIVPMVVISAPPVRVRKSKKLLERERMVVITISGLHGAGKTTAALALAKKFKLRYVCAGSVFRQLAKERRMTLDEFSRYAERRPSIDHQIDRQTVAAAKSKNVLIDARLAGWMAKKADLRILLTAPLEERVKRIALREKRKYREVLNETRKRERSEAKRFKQFYSIDVNDNSSFDIVLNTERFTIKEMVRILEFAVKQFIRKRS